MCLRGRSPSECSNTCYLRCACVAPRIQQCCFPLSTLLSLRSRRFGNYNVRRRNLRVHLATVVAVATPNPSISSLDKSSSSSTMQVAPTSLSRSVSLTAAAIPSKSPNPAGSSGTCNAELLGRLPVAIPRSTDTAPKSVSI